MAALMTGTALPALAASPAGDVPFAVLAQQNSAVTPEQVEALISQIGTVTRSRRAAIVAALDAYNQLDDAGKAAVTNFGVLAEAQQILGIQDALAKCNVNYDAVEDCWAITTRMMTASISARRVALAPTFISGTRGTRLFSGKILLTWALPSWISMTSFCAVEIISTLTFAIMITPIMDTTKSLVNGLHGPPLKWKTVKSNGCETFLSADTVIMRFEGTDYSKFDYTWTEQDRQAITDIIDLYNLLKAVTPEVREKALCN